MSLNKTSEVERMDGADDKRIGSIEDVVSDIPTQAGKPAEGVPTEYHPQGWFSRLLYDIARSFARTDEEYFSQFPMNYRRYYRGPRF